MPRIATVILFALTLLAGCTRHSSSDSTWCSSLSPTACERDARCEVRTGCCGATPICVPAGSAVLPCPLCNVCSGLDEASCKANSQCRADYCDTCACKPTFTACTLAGGSLTPCPALGCDPQCQSCNGLDEKSCRAASATLGCTAEMCPDCHGGQYFLDCAAPNAGQSACPASCPSGCHSQQDCQNGAYCQPPGAPVCGGACAPGVACGNDGDCASGQVCDHKPCTCSGTGLVCIPACHAATDCAEGQSCVSGHCQSTACTNTTDCPHNFECVLSPPSNRPECQRRACISGSDCVGGTCVDGACYGSLGTCMLPVP
jgi:hypothetical protein